MLANNREFNWPYAPLASGKGLADLRQPFAKKGLGFIAGVQLDPRRKQEYLIGSELERSPGRRLLFPPR